MREVSRLSGNFSRAKEILTWVWKFILSGKFSRISGNFSKEYETFPDYLKYKIFLQFILILFLICFYLFLFFLIANTFCGLFGKLSGRGKTFRVAMLPCYQGFSFSECQCQCQCQCQCHLGKPSGKKKRISYGSLP